MWFSYCDAEPWYVDVEARQDLSCDTDAGISIELAVFADEDLDGFGAGPAQLACTNGSAPEGFSTSGTDCADDDDTVWAQLTYRAIDEDGDGVTLPASGELCTNGTLPRPFLATAHGNDCDDDDPLLTHIAVLYPDHDGDGIGAPPRQLTCIGTSVPPGLSRGGYDDDDADPDVIESDEEDELLELLLLES